MSARLRRVDRAQPADQRPQRVALRVSGHQRLGQRHLVGVLEERLRATQAELASLREDSLKFLLDFFEEFQT